MTDLNHRLTQGAVRRLTGRWPRVPWVGLVTLVRRIIDVQSNERTSLAAAGTAFWLLIAAFPAAIAVISIFGLVIPPQTVAKTLNNLTTFAPGTLGQTLTAQLQDAAQSDPSTLSIGLVVSLTVTLWSASAGAYSFAKATQLSYSLPPVPYIRARIRSFVAALVGVLALGLLAFAVTAVIVLNDHLGTVLEILLSVLVEIPVGLLLVTCGRGRQLPVRAAAQNGNSALAARRGPFGGRAVPARNRIRVLRRAFRQLCEGVRGRRQRHNLAAAVLLRRLHHSARCCAQRPADQDG